MYIRAFALNTESVIFTVLTLCFVCAVGSSASDWNCVSTADDNLSSSTSTSALDSPVRVCTCVSAISSSTGAVRQ